MSKQGEEYTGMNWDTGLNWELPNRENIALHGIPEIGISPAELEPDYNERQEESGRLAWELLERKNHD